MHMFVSKCFRGEFGRLNGRRILKIPSILSLRGQIQSRKINQFKIVFFLSWQNLQKNLSFFEGFEWSGIMQGIRWYTTHSRFMTGRSELSVWAVRTVRAPLPKRGRSSTPNQSIQQQQPNKTRIANITRTHKPCLPFSLKTGFITIFELWWMRSSKSTRTPHSRRGNMRLASGLKWAKGRGTPMAIRKHPKKSVRSA